MVPLYGENNLDGRIVGTVHIIIGIISLSANVVFIAVMSIERFLAIYFPLKAKAWITSSRLKKVGEDDARPSNKRRANVNVEKAHKLVTRTCFQGTGQSPHTTGHWR